MNPHEAYEICFKNKKLEPFIIKNPGYAFYYARDVIKDRWLEAEPIIIIDSSWAYSYAREVIKGRWLEAEDIIATSSYYAYLYALTIINGKLPENMHNAMLVHADKYAKRYFNLIK